jgi:hypothetical protein
MAISEISKGFPVAQRTEAAQGPAAGAWIRVDRNELAGAFGDLGTSLPLLVGMVLSAGLDSASVLIAFGLMQIFSALVYGIPMAVQPLKVVAALVIAQRLGGPVIYGAGFSIGLLLGAGAHFLYSRAARDRFVDGAGYGTMAK